MKIGEPVILLTDSLLVLVAADLPLANCS